MSFTESKGFPRKKAKIKMEVEEMDGELGTYLLSSSTRRRALTLRVSLRVLT